MNGGVKVTYIQKCNSVRAKIESLHVNKNLIDLLLEELEKLLPTDVLVKYSKQIYKEYNIFFSDNQLWNKVVNIFGAEFSELFRLYQDKVLANSFINSIVFKYYPNEIYVKYNLIKEWISKENETVLFEFASGSSRVDICRINGKSYAFEIKTEFDDFDRLDKQLTDYAKLFEYIYVVTPRNRFDIVKDKIPPFCGVILYNIRQPGEFKRWTKKKAQKSPYLSSLDQIKAMTSEDIKFILKERDYDVPISRKKREALLLNNFSNEQINKLFKEALKKKYKLRSEFIRENFDYILPIDIQTFFHNQIDPKLAYLKDSFTV